MLARYPAVRRSALAFAVLALVLPSFASAEIDATGKELRAVQRSCTIDGVRITLDVDRSVVLTGDTVKATLVADGDAGKQVAVEIAAVAAARGARGAVPGHAAHHAAPAGVPREGGGARSARFGPALIAGAMESAAFDAAEPAAPVQPAAP